MVGAAGAALVLGLAVIGGAGQDTASGSLFTVADLAAQTCVVSGAVGGLDGAQATNAEEVVSAAMTASGENQTAVRIAVMVADTESGLRNLDQGTADSIGLFQQRPTQGWGTAAQLMDPAYATDAFVRRLLAVPRWQQLAPWRAAQAVQHSAYADGSNYKAKWAAAGQITAEVLTNGTSASSCGQGSGTLAGPTATHGLPASYTVPASTPPEHARVVAFALGQLGKPYVWGAAGPSAYDCSGLTQAAWATVGVPLDHYTGDQQHQGAAVEVTALVPGDLVLTPGSDPPGPGVAGHVGIYLGDGLVLSAIDPQDGVAVQTWATFVSGGLIALRDPAPGE